MNLYQIPISFKKTINCKIEEVTLFFSCLYNNERPLVVNVGGSSGSKYSRYIPEQVWEVKYLVQCQL